MKKEDILGQLKWYVRLGALHGKNAFALRNYEQALTSLKQLPEEIFEKKVSTWPEIKGLSPSIRKTIEEAENNDNQLLKLLELEKKTPNTLLKLLFIKGLSPLRLKRLWEELDITSAAQLQEACLAGKVSSLKGFGEKTQSQLLESLAFHDSQQGFVRWDTALKLAATFEESYARGLGEGGKKTEEGALHRTGALLRGAERLSCLEWLVLSSQDLSVKAIEVALRAIGICKLSSSGRGSPFRIQGCLSFSFSGDQRTWDAENAEIGFVLHICHSTKSLQQRKALSSATPAHLSLLTQEGHSLYNTLNDAESLDLESLYKACNWPFIPAYLREGAWTSEDFQALDVDELVQVNDLQGVLHCHSTYSDGQHSLEEMARQAKGMGYTYLGITDHSQSAFYAGGLQLPDIKAQHEEIDHLNQLLAPFRIFKGIECDILPDGTLDYTDEVLERFDFVITSIHSHLQMDKETATRRLLRAIAHPRVDILGHVSGRLLLERKGYDLDYGLVLQSCSKHGVAIEFNANPRRLDLSWSWIPVAQRLGVLVSINPDAHTTYGIKDMLSTLPIAQKGALKKANTLNAFSLEKIATHFRHKRQKK